MKKYFLLLILFTLLSGWMGETIAQPYCNQPQGTAGFPADIPCQTAICAMDGYCCSTNWDGICASEAAATTACINCLGGIPANFRCEAAIPLTMCSIVEGLPQ